MSRLANGKAPENVLEYLKGVRFPARKDQIVHAARQQGAPNDIVGALGDSDLVVRKLAAEALSQLGADADGLVPAVAELLKDADVGARRKAAEILSSVGPAGHAAVEPLAEALKDTDDLVQRWAALAL